MASATALILAALVASASAGLHSSKVTHMDLEHV